MTLPREFLGDQGQRFMVLTKNWPSAEERWQRAGYATTRAKAHEMAEAFKLCPSCDDAKVIDRGITFHD
jgi:hypothetical protein